ncbi:MAG: S9 family peptidase, partial [Burkholderiales bacterium]|nr:S9 family peptidase [Burkholderiales bacterium]
MAKFVSSARSGAVRRMTALGCALACMLSMHGGSVLAASVQLPSASASGAQESGKKLITHDVYANWRSIQGSVLSRDGRWAAYALVAQEADGEIVVRNVQTAQEWRAPRGTAPAFSADGRYVAFAVQPTRAELDKAKKEKKKGDELPKPGVGIMDLANGKVEIIARVKRYAWPEEQGNLLAVWMDAPVKKDSARLLNKDAGEVEQTGLDADLDSDQQSTPMTAEAALKKQPGSDLLVLDMAAAKRFVLKDVSEFTWTKNGQLLAYSVSVKPLVKLPQKKTESAASQTAVSASQTSAGLSAGSNRLPDSAREGVYVWNAHSGESKSVLSGAGSYRHLSFDEVGQQLAFTSNRDDLALKHALGDKPLPKPATSESDKHAGEELVSDGAKDAPKDTSIYTVFYWHSGDHAAIPLVNQKTPGMPTAWGPSAYAALNFSKDGQRLFLGTAALPKAEPKDAPEPMKVDLWHWKDPELQSMQKVKAEKEKQRSYKAVVHLADKRFVQLGNPHLPQIVVNDNPHFALGVSDLPYQMLQSWDALYDDIYAVDLQTGKARLLAQKLRFSPSLSPAGKYVLAFDATSSTWQCWSTADGTKTNLTGKLKVRFDNARRDTPEAHNAYGMAGWTDGDTSVVLYDQFDLWAIDPQTQASRNLSMGYGRKNMLELRYANLDSDKKINKEDDPAPFAETKALPSGSWLLTATHSENRSTGIFRQSANGGDPEQLLLADKLIGGLIKAKKADTLLYTQQSFVEFPDLWAGTLSLKNPQKISHANPQQAQYNWGRQELIEFTSADGKKLKALLAKPENFDPSKKYPMMVYIYENMSDNLYRYVPPAPSHNINVTRYLSNGYLVLRPDIVYKTGHPGKSAYNAVIPAVQKVIAQGYVDPKRIGIQGHSWGAYEVNYLITQTTMFRAAEAGASMANMISGYGGIRWGTGMSRAFQYEKQQSRIGGAPWNKTAEYIENSPIFFVDKVQTPYLTIHNDDDDAVPWYQAIEFFTALRQLGKEAYWFNYNGEKHGLKERDHMKHYT